MFEKDHKIKILFATDFSPSSKIALDTIMNFRQHYSLEVTLIHAITSFWKVWISSGAYSKEALQRLQSWQQQISPKAVEANQCIVSQGNAADIIVQQANKLKPELICLGAKMSSQSGRYKTGTTVQSVVRLAKQEVWICKTSTLNSVLCGIDGSKPSAKALNYAINICRSFSAKLCIVHSLPNIDYNPLGLDERELAKEEQKFKEKSIEKIEAFLKPFDFRGIKEVEHSYRWGMPANTILDMAEDFSYDLIIIGAKGQSRLSHVLMGSTAEKVLCYMPCSLLVVK